MKLVNESRIKAVVASVKPGVKVSQSYIEALDRHIRELVVRHATRDGYMRTLREDSFR